jgi:CRISPR system Cascade subunit CasB
MSTSPVERRAKFIKHLHGLHHGASSGIPSWQATCRATLARLRRSLAGPAQQAGAYDVVFPYEPPTAEQEVWLLLAGLFALHPQPARRRETSLGSSLKALAKLRETSASRRFEQLLARDRDALPHHLRQLIRLLADEDIPINYSVLLDDLIELMGDNHREQTAQLVRLRWARDFHSPDITATPTSRLPQ